MADIDINRLPESARNIRVEYEYSFLIEKVITYTNEKNEEVQERIVDPDSRIAFEKSPSFSEHNRIKSALNKYLNKLNRKVFLKLNMGNIIRGVIRERGGNI